MLQRYMASICNTFRVDIRRPEKRGRNAIWGDEFSTALLIIKHTDGPSHEEKKGDCG